MSKIYSLKHQASDRLNGFKAYGCEKLKENGTPTGNRNGRITSKQTMTTYHGVVGRFVSYCSGEGVSNLKDCELYARRYLETRIAEGKSPWTIHTERAALAMLFQKSATEIHPTIPKRHRNRKTKNKKVSKHHDPNKPQSKELERFCKATGLRASEVRKITPRDIYGRAGKTYVSVKGGKGGKDRYVECIDRYPLQLKKEFLKDEVIFKQIDQYAPIHIWRQQYANDMYDRIKRDYSSITNEKELYKCRHDKLGQVFDRKALLRVSRNLGHNRESVVVDSYLYEENSY